MNKLRERYNKLLNAKESIKKERSNLQSRIIDLREDYIATEEGLQIVKTLGLKMQQRIKYHISDITSLALDSIFPNPYSLVLDFVERNGTSECDILFERDGYRVKPVDASGGGAIDIASLALRIASWSLQKGKKSGTIILDEPFHFLSEEHHVAASTLIKEISNKLGIQFIIITHVPTFAIYADKNFRVLMKNKKSKIV